jgi:beta-barrel assembly-enhancing protease
MTNFLKQLTILLVSFAVTNTSLAATFSDEQAGDEFFRMVQKQVPLADDPLIDNFINKLGYKLASYSDAPQDPFHFFVIKSGVINAFAGPGGYIGVYGGLIAATKSESELAGVMAHEIAHVTQDHLQRGSDRMSNLTIPAIAAMVAGVATGNPQIAIGSIAGVTAGAAQYSINVTRSYEEEADSIGIEILAKAGFNPYGMADFFEKLQEKSRYDSQPPPILMDHPVTQQRIAQARERAKKLNKKKDYHSSPSYYLIKARVIAQLSQDPMRLLSYAKNHVKKHPSSPYAQYLLALAYSNDRDYQSAQDILAPLAKADPLQIIYAYTQAQVAYLAKDYDGASAYLKDAYENSTDFYPVIVFYGLALMRDDQSQKAQSLLEKYQRTYADDADFWFLLSKVYAANDNLSDAYLARAKAYEIQGNDKTAMVQLQMAQKQPNQNDFTKSIIQAGINQLKNKMARKS